jgi:DNA-binding SARP family transcriptional activator/uncharacterized protein YjbI with pentapeptide repeats
METGLMVVGGEQDTRPASSSPDWRVLAKLLDAGQYERAAGLLERAQAASQERGDTVLSHVLDAVRYICLACGQLQAEGQWHSRAHAEVDRREEELRQELQAILSLLNEAGALAAASGRENPEVRVSLWQRIQGFLGRGGAWQWSQLGLSGMTSGLIAGDAGPLAASGAATDSEERTAEPVPSSPASAETPDLLPLPPGKQGPTPVSETTFPQPTPGHEADLEEAHPEEALSEEEQVTGSARLEAPLEEMPLGEAMLEEMLVAETHLAGANSTEVESGEADPGKANLGEADLGKALIEEERVADPPGAELSLEGMPLTEAMLEEILLNETNLEDANPDETMAEEESMSGSPSAEAPFEGTFVPGADLEKGAEEALVARALDAEALLEETPSGGMDSEEAGLAGVGLAEAGLTEAGLTEAIAIKMPAVETFPAPSPTKDASSVEADLPGTPAETALDRDTALPAAHSLVVHTLGSFRVYVDGRPVENWAGRKCRSILKYLLIHRAQPTHAEVLMDVFWPDAEPKSARRNLYQAIYQLRQSLQAGEPDLQYIVYEDGRYALNPDVHVWVDSEAFMQHYQAAQQLAREGQVDEAVGEYEAAESLYEGEFLGEDRYEEWSLVLRENLRHAHLDILDRLSEYYYEHAQYATCVTFCQAILAEDKCREDTHRRLMRCYMGQGQRHLALRQYHLCTEALKEELDVSPMPATVDLYLQIQNNPTHFPET